MQCSKNIEQDYSMLDTDFYTPDLKGIETIDNAATKHATLAHYYRY